ncbi:MAG: glycoside hydrolase family 15 protein [Xanthobacteraceae bacterium]
MPCRIEDYAIIGDCESAALVGRNGSIDWLCWPRFDSDACFAALLGTPANGRWIIAPRDPATRVTRRYRANTLILETRFESEDGAATLIDFMPMPDKRCDLIRLVVGERGALPMRVELVIRFGYGAIVPWVTRLEDGALRAIAGPDMLVLRTPVGLHGQGLKTVGDFVITAGHTLPFVLTYSASHLPPMAPPNPFTALAATESYWTGWASRCDAGELWPEAITRSLLTLKALTYAPTGGIIAAPTTSLPEQLGGPRNWDYRFCWLRDATFTLLALMNGGYYEEADAWREWLLRAVAGSPNQMQIMYGIAGERRLTEWAVPWLAGYEGAQPVLIGNAAHDQLQLDVYGELMDALHIARRHGLGMSASGWELQRAFLDHVEKIWQEPDAGIWEIRGPPCHFTYSKVMTWVAFDRAIKSAEQFGLLGPVGHWRKVRDAIHADVCTRGFDRELGSFVQCYGTKELDASLLLLPSTGFLPPTDSRIRGTVEAIERSLMVDGFVRRYDTQRTEDGLPPGEGVFLACSFWLVDAYVMLGRLEDAYRLFERLMTLRNDVGLMSEQYDPAIKRFLGNFPQAFSHVALVNSAFNLGRARKPVEQRAEQPAQV